MESRYRTLALMREANIELLESLRLLRRLVGTGDAFFELANLAPSHLPAMQSWADGQPEPIREYLRNYQTIFKDESSRIAEQGFSNGIIAISDDRVQGSLARVLRCFRASAQPAPIWAIVFSHLLTCIRANNLRCPEWIGFNIELPHDRRKYRVAQTVNLMPFGADMFTCRHPDLPISVNDYRFARRAGDYFPKNIIDDAPSVGNLLFFDTHIDNMHPRPTYSGIPILLRAHDAKKPLSDPRTYLLEIDYLVDIKQWRNAARHSGELAAGTPLIRTPSQPESLNELDPFFRSFVTRWIGSRRPASALHIYFGTVMSYLTEDQMVPVQGISMLSVPSIFWSIDKSIQGAASALNFCYHRQIPVATVDCLIAFSQSILQGVGHLARLQDTIELGSSQERSRKSSIFAHETKYLIQAIDSRKTPPKALDLIRGYLAQVLQDADGVTWSHGSDAPNRLREICQTAADTAWQMLSVRRYIDQVAEGAAEGTDEAFEKFLEARQSALKPRLDLESLHRDIFTDSRFAACTRGAICAAFSNALFHSNERSGLGFRIKVFLDPASTSSMKRKLVIENTIEGLDAFSPDVLAKRTGTLHVIRGFCESCNLDPDEVWLFRYSLSSERPYTEVWRTVLPLALEEPNRD